MLNSYHDIDSKMISYVCSLTLVTDKQTAHYLQFFSHLLISYFWIKHSFIIKCSRQLNTDFVGVLFYMILECFTNKLTINM